MGEFGDLLSDLCDVGLEPSVPVSSVKVCNSFVGFCGRWSLLCLCVGWLVGCATGWGLYHAKVTLWSKSLVLVGGDWLVVR